MIFSCFLVFLSFIIFSSFANEYETINVQVKVDHFSFVNDDKFEIRVLINDANWKDTVNGPIFVYFGGEQAIDKYVENTGFLWEAATRFNALVLFVEHRYYGTSLPYGEKSLTDKEYFGYLTEEQALRDAIDVIYYIVSLQWKEGTIPIENPTSEMKHPVIAFGGLLAAWSRTKYPHVIAGALASSAGITLFPGFSECGLFYQILTQVFGIDYPKCPTFVRNAWEAFYTVTDEGKSEEGKKWLNDGWNLCTPISTYDDIDSLVLWFWEQLWTIGMANYPYAHNYLLPLPAYPVKLFCSVMVEATEDPKELVKAMFNALNTVININDNFGCYGVKKPDDPSKIAQFDPWALQNCMEVVIPTCADEVHDMFLEQDWNITERSDSCYEKYKVRPEVDQLKIEYGGKTLDAASNIIFSSGLLDPWNYGDPKENISETVIAVVLPNCAHRLDLMGSNEKDPQEVTEARILYEKYFTIWISEFYKRK